jgi:hypothetical protein
MNSFLQISTDRIKQLSNFLKKQEENHKFTRSLEAGITFFLISFFLFFAIKPTVLTISSLYGDIKSKEAISSQMKTKIDNLMKAQQSYSLAQGRYQIIESSLPSRPSFYEAFDQVKETLNNSNSQFNSSGFDLSNLNEKNSIDPNIRTYFLSLNFKNSFSNSLKIITDLLNNRRLINISSITFNSDTSGLGTGFIASFFYWQK